MGGHVGYINKKGVRYDFGRYAKRYKSYNINPFAPGPNILRVGSGGLPDPPAPRLYYSFKFNVRGKVNRVVDDEFRRAFSTGSRVLPPWVMDKYNKTNRPKTPLLEANKRYMWSDWSPTNQCTNFTSDTILRALSEITLKNSTMLEWCDARSAEMAIEGAYFSFLGLDPEYRYSPNNFYNGLHEEAEGHVSIFGQPPFIVESTFLR